MPGQITRSSDLSKVEESCDISCVLSHNLTFPGRSIDSSIPMLGTAWPGRACHSSPERAPESVRRKRGLLGIDKIAVAST